MSLDWNVTAVKDYDLVTTSPFLDYNGSLKWHPATDALVWYSMICGFNEITEKNVDEVWRRVSMFEVVKSMMANNEGPLVLTRDDIVRHIGLHTNASRLSAREADKKFLDYVQRERNHLLSGKKTLAEHAPILTQEQYDALVAESKRIKAEAAT